MSVDGIFAIQLWGDALDRLVFAARVEARSETVETGPNGAFVIGTLK
jgi:hypothetical protein